MKRNEAELFGVTQTTRPFSFAPRSRFTVRSRAVAYKSGENRGNLRLSKDLGPLTVLRPSSIIRSLSCPMLYLAETTE